MTRTAIHRRIHVAAGGRVAVGASVSCPENGRRTPLEACKTCPKCVAVGDGAVECRVRPRRTHAPEQAPIGEVLEPDVVCLDGGVTVDEAACAFEEDGAPIAVVLDADHHAIGVVRPADLASAPPSRRVETLASPLLIALLERANVSDAIELVVQRGVSHVPVLGAGRILGIVSARSIIRWLTQSLQEARRDVPTRGPAP
jgi:CBS domain-containing protein